MGVHIETLDKDCIKILGTTYYSESYLKEMMNREHSRGKKEGTNIHVAEFKIIELIDE